MGQVLPVFAHCSEYGEDPVWFGAQKPAWGPLWVSIFGARRGVEGKEPKETKEPFPSPPPSHPALWRQLGHPDPENPLQWGGGGGHGDRLLGGSRGAGLGRPAQSEKEQARGELSLALVLAAADGLSQDGEAFDSLHHPFSHLTLVICPKGTSNVTLNVPPLSPKNTLLGLVPTLLSL